MKSRQLWIIAGTAVVSFALGVAVAPSWRKSDPKSDSGIRQTKSNGRSSSANGSGEVEEFPGRSRVGTREEKKKPGEPRISIPSRNVEKTIRTLHPISSFDNFGGMKDALALVGASEQQTGEVMALLDRAKSEILSEEKNHLKAIQTDDTRIRLDTQGMEAPAKVIVQQLQNDIRATLPPDLAAILVSNTAWNQYYRTDENLYPTLTISRGTSGLWGSEDGKSWERRFRVDPKFPDDGTPIPADQVFDDRWKPFLKGLTLLPQNEK